MVSSIYVVSQKIKMSVCLYVCRTPSGMTIGASSWLAVYWICYWISYLRCGCPASSLSFRAEHAERVTHFLVVKSGVTRAYADDGAYACDEARRCSGGRWRGA